MAQFEFLGMHGDSWAFVKKICESQAVKAIVDLKYETREAIILEATDSRLEAFVKGRERLYFTGPFTEFPLEFREIRLEHGVRYCVDEKRGGPLIGFIPAARFPEGGMTFLNTGMLFYHREYWSPRFGRWEKPKAELIASYKRMVGIAKAQMSRAREARTWIGPIALEQVRKGHAKIVAVSRPDPG